MQNILDHWKENGGLNFRLAYSSLNEDPNGYRLFVNDIPCRITESEDIKKFRHETENSVAVCQLSGCHQNYLEISTCECDAGLQGCAMKKKFPDLHS
uniref:EGF-like domain-containing protein n=1 Tax=Steinernema glaseri TaxID=37863 RepID=A0A1I7YSI0_9BILA